MKEVKFNSMAEVYAWASAGKPIMHIDAEFMTRTVYKADQGGYYGLMPFNDNLISYYGIEETPVKKAYAYWSPLILTSKVDNPKVLVRTDRELQNDELFGYKRDPDFDLTFPEKREE